MTRGVTMVGIREATQTVVIIGMIYVGAHWYQNLLKLSIFVFDQFMIFKMIIFRFVIIFQSSFALISINISDLGMTDIEKL